MNLQKPYTAICSAATGDVLKVLNQADVGLTGRTIARLGQYNSHTSILTALKRLVDSGIVKQQRAGNANLYSLNRLHIAMPAIAELLEIKSTLISRLDKTIGSWDIQPLKATIFGSFARGEGDLDSDIDLFIVEPAIVSKNTRPIWEKQLDELSDSVLSWTGNRLGLVELRENEVGELEKNNRPLWDAINQGIDLQVEKRETQRQ